MKALSVLKAILLTSMWCSSTLAVPRPDPESSLPDGCTDDNATVATATRIQLGDAIPGCFWQRLNPNHPTSGPRDPYRKWLPVPAYFRVKAPPSGKLNVKVLDLGFRNKSLLIKLDGWHRGQLITRQGITVDVSSAQGGDVVFQIVGGFRSGFGGFTFQVD